LKTVIIYGADGRQDVLFPTLEKIGFKDIGKIVLVENPSWSTEALQETRRELVEITEKITGFQSDEARLSLMGLEIQKLVLKGDSLVEYIKKQQQLFTGITDEKEVILMDAGVRVIGSFFLISLTDTIDVGRIWHYSEDTNEIIEEEWPKFPLRSLLTSKNDRKMLEMIEEEGKISMKRLVEETELSASTISRRTQKFENLNLIDRIREGKELYILSKPTANMVLTVTDINNRGKKEKASAL